MRWLALFSNMNGYCYFILGILVLAAGYFTYGRVLERIFRPDASRQTPAVACTDGVDYVVMPRWRVFSHPAAEHCRAGAHFRRRHGRAVRAGRASVDRFRLHSGRNGARLLLRHDFPAAQGENLPEILGATWAARPSGSAAPSASYSACWWASSSPWGPPPSCPP